MNEPGAHQQPLLLKYLSPDRARAILERDPRLIVPVGTTEQHGPHLPFGCDTIIVEHLANHLSAEFGVLRAPTVEYGVNSTTGVRYPGNASLRAKTLHRFLNDLVGTWELGGVQQFVILTAHGHDPHQEALSTLSTRRATVRTVDIFTVPLSVEGPSLIHGGEIDTSLLLYIDKSLVDLDQARDFGVSRRRFRFGPAIPSDSPGSIGFPTCSSAEKGEQIYNLIYHRIAERVFGYHPNVGTAQA